MRLIDADALLKRLNDQECEMRTTGDRGASVLTACAELVGEMAIVQPSLDENGLARCGCGGRLALHKMPESNYDSVEDKPVFFVNCSNDDCSLFFGYYHFAEDAIKAANRAMGVKGADE